MNFFRMPCVRASVPPIRGKLFRYFVLHVILGRKQYFKIFTGPKKKNNKRISWSFCLSFDAVEFLSFLKISWEVLLVVSAALEHGETK